MSESLNNKELITVGHEFAKAMTSDTPIIDIAKMMSRLANGWIALRLRCVKRLNSLKGRRRITWSVPKTSDSWSGSIAPAASSQCKNR